MLSTAASRSKPSGSAAYALIAVGEDRAADREADVALEAGAGAQPFVDLRVRGTTAEHDARHVVAAAVPDEVRDRVARVAVVDALDLPDVGLHPARAELEDRIHHQPGTELGCRSARRCRRPTRAGTARPARGARTGTCGRGCAASRRAGRAWRSAARSSRRRRPGCSGRAPSRSPGRTPRSSRRTPRRARSRTRSGPTSRPASRARNRRPWPRGPRPGRTGHRPGLPRMPSARPARPRARSPPR